jgi:hypothetical protein
MSNSWLINAFMQHMDLILGICFAATVLLISTFVTLYHNYLSHLRMAEAYKYSSRVKSETSEVEMWHSYAEKFARTTRLRAYSANLCIWSLAPLLFSLVFTIISFSLTGIPWPWFVFLGFFLVVWFVMVFLSICIYFGEKEWKLFSWGWPARPTLQSWVRDL